MSPARPSVAPSAPPLPPQATIDARLLRAESMARASVALTGIGAAILVGRALDLHAPACPFRTITGIACPGCGMTRLGAALSRGDLGLALERDPAGVGFLAALVVVALVSAVFVLGARDRPPGWLGARWVVAGFLVLLGAHWITTLAWGGMLTL